MKSHTFASVKNLTKVLILSLCILQFASISLFAKEKVPVHTWWEKEVDGNRSESHSPSLTKDESNVYLYSEKALENVSITISDVTGRIAYTETVTIPAGMEHAISIEALPAGQYYISVVQGSNNLIGIFTK